VNPGIDLLYINKKET